MKKKETKNAARILSSWRKAMPFYYAIVWIVITSIVLIKWD
tara:strand:+ start:262 stop:384 length:123 start_codon:yes stop_codon:yes gene_type:complete